MVKPSTRPGFVVFQCKWGDIGSRVLHAVVPLRVALVSIGINAWVDHDHHVFQKILRERIVFIEQLVNHLHAGIGRNRLISMDIVAQPHDRRHTGVRFAGEHTNAFQMIFPDRIQLGHILR
jgi:hypothetical protein